MNNVMKMLAGSFIILVSGLAVSPVGAQEKAAAAPEKRIVRMKIETSENGKTTVIDTTFNLSDPADRERYHVFMQTNNHPRGTGRPMKKVVVRMDHPDLLSDDSLSVIEKSVKIISDGDVVRIEGDGDGGMFEFPVPPEPPVPPCCERFEGSCTPFCLQQRDGPGGNLLDVLHAVPMNRIKNFRIKENKKGTRIIIDVDRTPLLDIPPPPDAFFYKDHWNKHRRGDQQGRWQEKTIIIDTDTDKKAEN